MKKVMFLLMMMFTIDIHALQRDQCEDSPFVLCYLIKVETYSDVSNIPREERRTLTMIPPNTMKHSFDVLSIVKGSMFILDRNIIVELTTTVAGVKVYMGPVFQPTGEADLGYLDVGIVEEGKKQYGIGTLKIEDLFADCPRRKQEKLKTDNYELLIPEDSEAEKIQVRAECKTISEREAIVRIFNNTREMAEDLHPW